MSELIERAFATLKTLPAEDQDRLAWEIIERVEDKTEWDRIISAQRSQKWLEKNANLAMHEYGKIQKNVSMMFISVEKEDLLREQAYWRGFDDLPEEIRKLAEENYRLWQENPAHPSLRFKKIHDTMPIFSFRVGMRHRTVGVETDDGRIVWFWVGSFEGFRRLIEAT